MPNNESYWITCIILGYLETFHNDKMGSWKLIYKKGKQWLLKNGIQYEDFKEEVKKFYYGLAAKPKNQVRLSKSCGKCKNSLTYLKSLINYQSGRFECDICASSNLIIGGVFHCDDCEYDLCEECNDEQLIKCGFCNNDKSIL